MEAIRLHAFGPADNLVLETLPDLSPGVGEARIAVEAAGVHLIDTTLRRGDPSLVPSPDLPTIPGREVAGVVDTVGEAVEPGWLGRRVVAYLGPVPGGYASQAVTAAGSLFPIPDGATAAEAVAVVGTGRTAMSILELEPVGAGDTVFVPSAAGGLGWLLVESAKRAGATVVAAARGAAKTRLLHDLGAHLVVDYGSPGWAEALPPLTVVYDGVGGEVGRAGLEHLVPGGRLVMFGYASGAPTPFTQDDVVARGISVGWSLGARMTALPGGISGLAARALTRLAAGEWRPLVTIYPLRDAARAHADLEARRTVGKVVLEP